MLQCCRLTPSKVGDELRGGRWEVCGAVYALKQSPVSQPMNGRVVPSIAIQPLLMAYGLVPRKFIRFQIKETMPRCCIDTALALLDGQAQVTVLPALRSFTQCRCCFRESDPFEHVRGEVDLKRTPNLHLKA